MTIELQGKETFFFWLNFLGASLLAFISSFALFYFIYRGVLFGEFSAFKIALLLFIPYGLYSICQSIMVKAHRIQFLENEVVVQKGFIRQRYNADRASFITVKTHVANVEIQILDSQKKRLVTLLKNRKNFTDLTLIRRAAKISGLESLK